MKLKTGPKKRKIKKKMNPETLNSKENIEQAKEKLKLKFFQIILEYYYSSKENVIRMCEFYFIIPTIIIINVVIKQY